MKHITLAEARDAKGLTQQQLENISGVDRTRIAKMESNPRVANPTVETVRRLEEALELERGTLVFGASVDLAEQVA